MVLKIRTKMLSVLIYDVIFYYAILLNFKYGYWVVKINCAVRYLRARKKLCSNTILYWYHIFGWNFAESYIYFNIGNLLKSMWWALFLSMAVIPNSKETLGIFFIKIKRNPWGWYLVKTYIDERQSNNLWNQDNFILNVAKTI